MNVTEFYLILLNFFQFHLSVVDPILFIVSAPPDVEQFAIFRQESKADPPCGGGIDLKLDRLVGVAPADPVLGVQQLSVRQARLAPNTRRRYQQTQQLQHFRSASTATVSRDNLHLQSYRTRRC